MGRDIAELGASELVEETCVIDGLGIAGRCQSLGEMKLKFER